MSNYKENRSRVFEICGIDPKDRKYNCHHEQFRSEGGSDEKSNLFPMEVGEHKQLHKTISEQEGYPDPNGGKMSRKEQRKARKRRKKRR